MVCAAQFSCCSAELHFFDGYGPSSQEMNSNDYSTRFMESYCIMNMSCMPAVLKKSGSQWPNSCKPAKHSIWKALFSGFRVCPGRAETVDKWGGKTNHQLIAYSQQHFCQKLPKSVNLCWSYSVVFETQCNSVIEFFSKVWGDKTWWSCC